MHGKLPVITTAGDHDNLSRQIPSDITMYRVIRATC